MSDTIGDFQTDFHEYWDGNHLFAPAPVAPGTVSASDNGVMFTSEYEIMSARLGLMCCTPLSAIYFCIDKFGVLSRRPIGQKSSQEGPDDYLALLNLCREYGVVSAPRLFLVAYVKNLGFMNNVTPGKKTWQSFLVRQPQLVAATINAAFPSMKNPTHYLVRLLAFPLYLYSSILILFSCRNTPVSDTTSRRLAWHLQNNLKKNSILCKLSAMVWFNRLHRDYVGGMKGVAAVYYYPQGNNPYMKWWVE